MVRYIINIIIIFLKYQIFYLHVIIEIYLCILTQIVSKKWSFIKSIFINRHKLMINFTNI